MKQYDVVALGELLIDFSPYSTNEAGYPVLSANPGGAPANFLAALTKYGCKTAMIGKVGDDTFGRALVRTLEEAGIETRGVLTDPDVFTTLAFVSLDASGNRDFSFARKPGADICLTPEEVDETLISDTKVFHFGTLSMTDAPHPTPHATQSGWQGNTERWSALIPICANPCGNGMRTRRTRLNGACTRRILSRSAMRRLTGCGESGLRQAPKN